MLENGGRILTAAVGVVALVAALIYAGHGIITRPVDRAIGPTPRSSRRPRRRETAEAQERKVRPAVHRAPNPVKRREAPHPAAKPGRAAGAVGGRRKWSDVP